MTFVDKYRSSTPVPVLTLLLLCWLTYDSGGALANRLIQTRLKTVGKTNSPARTRGVMGSWCNDLRRFVALVRCFAVGRFS